MGSYDPFFTKSAPAVGFTLAWSTWVCTLGARVNDLDLDIAQGEPRFGSY
jgi:hypothetical protein